jgi:hypothetical protein
MGQVQAFYDFGIRVETADAFHKPLTLRGGKAALGKIDSRHLETGRSKRLVVKGQ